MVREDERVKAHARGVQLVRRLSRRRTKHLQHSLTGVELRKGKKKNADTDWYVQCWLGVAGND